MTAGDIYTAAGDGVQAFAGSANTSVPGISVMPS
jgi:hypothetical protein